MAEAISQFMTKGVHFAVVEQSNVLLNLHIIYQLAVNNSEWTNRRLIGHVEHIKHWLAWWLL